MNIQKKSDRSSTRLRPWDPAIVLACGYLKKASAFACQMIPSEAMEYEMMPLAHRDDETLAADGIIEEARHLVGRLLLQHLLHQGCFLRRFARD
jgi:hypothetical protein